MTDAKAKKETLKARAQSAKTQQQVNDMVKGIGYSNAYAAFDRMEEKVQNLEAQSEATAELNAADQSLEDRFKQLEGSDVDAELSDIKKQLGKSKDDGPKGALPEAKSTSADSLAIEQELSDMRRNVNDR